MMANKSTILDDVGFSLIEILVGLGIMSILVMAVATMNYRLVKQNAMVATPIQLDTFRRNLIALTLANSSWDMTTKTGVNPASMSCLTSSGTPCIPSSSGQSFAIYDSSGNLYYDATTPGNGLTASGQLCPSASNQNSFNAAIGAGNDNCPFRFNLTWTPICPPSGPCLNPQVMVKADLVYNPATRSLTLNPGHYSAAPIYRTSQ
jgi:prepilin-type N-terminal cleavage/methylation domain-containing protein